MNSKSGRSKKTNVDHSHVDSQATSSSDLGGLNPSLVSTRREALSALAATAILTMVGCAVSPQGSKLDRMASDLDAALAQAPDDVAPELTATSRQIQSEVRAMVTSQEVFSAEFDRLTDDPNVPDDVLLSLTSQNNKDRRAARKKLLDLQDELHEAVPEDLWPDVREILTRKARLASIKTSLRQA